MSVRDNGVNNKLNEFHGTNLVQTKHGTAALHLKHKKGDQDEGPITAASTFLLKENLWLCVKSRDLNKPNAYPA